jgi:ABC-type hemin transport system substrate-binding protein
VVVVTLPEQSETAGIKRRIDKLYAQAAGDEEGMALADAFFAQQVDAARLRVEARDLDQILDDALREMGA